MWDFCEMKKTAEREGILSLIPEFSAKTHTGG
jgi:hypothetical protein